MATIRDVAREAGVSAGTVSNVLNRPGYVAASTRERVLAAIADLGFTPTARARRYRSGRERTLGLALADLANPFFVDVALGAEAEAKARGVGVVMVHDSEDVDRERDNLDILVQQRVHGIMLAPVEERATHLRRVDDRGIPLIYVDRVAPDSTGCGVRTDDIAGGRIAGEHLVALGHRRIAFAGSFDATTQTDLRFQGLAEAMSVVGAVPEQLPTGTWRIEDGRAVAALIHSRPRRERPTAVMCSNDLIALGVLLEFTHRGIDVPGEISVVGFDDLTWAGAATVPLTTVRQPRAELGKHAVSMLLDEIDRPDEHVHEHVLLAPELVVRESTSTAQPDAH